MDYFDEYIPEDEEKDLMAMHTGLIRFEGFGNLLPRPQDILEEEADLAGEAERTTLISVRRPIVVLDKSYDKSIGEVIMIPSGMVFSQTTIIFSAPNTLCVSTNAGLL